MRRFLITEVLAVFIVLGGATSLLAQEEPPCIENSPERRGEIGCSIVGTKPLPDGLKAPLFWHIDRFQSEAAAQAGAGPISIAFQAHGTWWLMSIETHTADHHKGEHVAAVQLPPLPEAPKHCMLVISAYIPAGMTSRVHLHSGVEAFYTVEGEQCLETAAKAFKIPKGQSLAVSTGTVMRLVATGDTPRRGLAVIVYDSSKPPTTRFPTERASELVSCAR